ncbi:hypothetical protein MMC14_002860 [Varicellaria rhodocarpa]|nr:hypothetical protein [Varicellaria rhodocarpa]
MPFNRSEILSLYRSLLRELPSRPLSTPSPIHKRIQASFAAHTTNSSSSPQDRSTTDNIQQAEQILYYFRAQSMYATLLERYNPGMNMDEEERVRLTARRVGMDLPEEWRK